MSCQVVWLKRERKSDSATKRSILSSVSAVIHLFSLDKCLGAMPLPIGKIILYILIIVFALLGMCVTIVVFYAMFTHRALVRRNRMDFLLFVNSYLSLLIIELLLTDMCVYSIYGYFHPESSFDGFWCRFKSYLLYIQGYVYFYSFLVQSIYRFCRIVFHTRPRLRSFRLYAVASVLLWVNAFWQMLPCLLLRFVDYMPSEYHCQFRLFDLSGSLLGLSINFLAPYLLALACYMLTMYCVRKRSAELTRINQQVSIRRDLLILKRIVTLMTFVAFVALPHVMLPIIYALDGALPPWATAFEWLTTAIALTVVAVIQIFISPVFRQIFIR